MKNSLEDLKVYQNFVPLLKYTYMILEKYPRIEQNGLVSDIKNHTSNALFYVIDAQKEFDLKDRINLLKKCDSELKMIKVLIRISYSFKFISSRNYGSWSRKLSDVCGLVIGWLNRCLKQ
jgi:hypothetical protein